MEVFVGVIMVTAVSALIAAPLLRSQSGRFDAAGHQSRELWEHERHIALLAIKEAQFDHATGKLSDDDYDTLRTGYERRALDAIEKLGDADESGAQSKPQSAAESPALFCPACGTSFAEDDKFCTGCGSARGNLG